MLKIIITDTHFGVKNNSLKFLENQLKIFRDLKLIINTHKESRIDLIHLGDLFDSRSTVNIYVFERVKRLFIELYGLLKSRNEHNNIVFLAGNHDFFSQNSCEINSIDSLIRPILPDCIYFTKDGGIYNSDLYLPWYDTEDIESLLTYTDNFEGKYIFTHTDLSQFPLKLKDKVIISGHIHKIHDAKVNSTRMINISPPYSINFNDANDYKKGIWLLEDDEIKLYINEVSLRFNSVYNSDVFQIKSSNIERGDNFNIYLNRKNLADSRYIDFINKLYTKTKYINIIPINEEIYNEGIDYDIDIDKMIYNMLGEELKDNFDIIKQRKLNED